MVSSRKIQYHLIFFVLTLKYFSRSSILINLPSNQAVDEYFNQLQLLLMEILHRTKIDQCYAIITDASHEKIFHKKFFEIKTVTYFFLKILDEEDLTSPNYQTIKSLKFVKSNDCDLIIILILNGIQMKKFLNFIDEHRILNTKVKYIMLYDYRILTKNLHHIWRKIISVLFIRKYNLNLQGSGRNSTRQHSIKFELLTVPYPSSLKNTFYSKKISEWKYGRFHGRTGHLFEDKAKHLEGNQLNVVVYEHAPMVQKVCSELESNSFTGIEVNIINALSKVMNFTSKFYETNDRDLERWGQKLKNDTYTGLIGQIVNRQADVALGDLRMYESYAQIMDFSVHSMECLTFLTPESRTDNSWQTLILPLSAGMWLGVFVSLLFVGMIFYSFSWLHNRNVRKQFKGKTRKMERIKTPEFKGSKKDNRAKLQHEKTLKLFYETERIKILRRKEKIEIDSDIFDNFSNCILLTFSMLLYISLPKMPRNWPLRVLTGWYWIYCILVTTTYRASFTAILANPSPKIKIDTLEELAESGIEVGAWGGENKLFFELAFDKFAQKIGGRLERINDFEDSAQRIAKGRYAYFDNEYFLRYLRTQKKSASGNKNNADIDVLHIMENCVVIMPISLGLEKNSPLKPNFDKYILRLAEGGFISKWLKDFTVSESEEKQPQEALMDLKKFWSSFIVLGVGYLLGIFALIGEQLYHKYIVQKHPLYDNLNPNIYYIFIKNRHYTVK